MFLIFVQLVFQIQGQLEVCDKNFCFFVVWTPKGILFEKVYAWMQYLYHIYTRPGTISGKPVFGYRKISVIPVYRFPVIPVILVSVIPVFGNTGISVIPVVW